MFNELTFQAAMSMGSKVGGSRVDQAARGGRERGRDDAAPGDKRRRKYLETFSRGYFG
jgi:hypothetical protein